MIINLDETTITERIVACIVNGIIECKKKFMKIAFVGVDKKEQKLFEELIKESGVMFSCFKDYEKAKEWVFKC